MNKCKKTIDGKHIIRKQIITYDEISNGYRVISKIPVYAEKCIACNKWVKLLKNENTKNSN